MDGFAFISELRQKRCDIPVIMLTARDSTADRIEGLDGGADDYLVKPFAFDELLARIRALLRRPRSRGLPALTFADIVLDPIGGVAQRAGRNMLLSVRGFSLLRVLLTHQNRVLWRAGGATWHQVRATAFRQGIAAPNGAGVTPGQVMLDQLVCGWIAAVVVLGGETQTDRFPGQTSTGLSPPKRGNQCSRRIIHVPGNYIH